MWSQAIQYDGHISRQVYNLMNIYTSPYVYLTQVSQWCIEYNRTKKPHTSLWTLCVSVHVCIFIVVELALYVYFQDDESSGNRQRSVRKSIAVDGNWSTNAQRQLIIIIKKKRNNNKTPGRRKGRSLTPIDAIYLKPLKKKTNKTLSPLFFLFLSIFFLYLCICFYSSAVNVARIYHGCDFLTYSNNARRAALRRI